MKPNSSNRWAIATVAAVAVALSADWLWQRRNDQEVARTAQIAIQGQLDAFRRGDYRAAYRFAAPEIQEKFPLPAFREMVEQGYPQIARSRSASFGPSEVHGNAVAVPVKVTGEDGVTIRAIYLMRREGASWRVAGVVDGRAAGGPDPWRRPPAPEIEPRVPSPAQPNRKGSTDAA